jgi:anti-anti-sigma factor
MTNVWFVSRNRRERSLISTTKNLAIGSSGQTAFLPPLFAIDAGKEGDAFVIRVKGELDLFECPRLVRALREAEASHAVRILLDLEELTFIDAAGLSALVAAWYRSVTDSNRLQVTHGKGNVADMFRLTALDMVLPFISPARSEQAQPSAVHIRT